MNGNQFYLTLPSNSKETNTAASFITTLPTQIQLDGNWECALCELVYPNTWYNVMPDDKQNMIQFFDVVNRTRQKIKIPHSRYEKIHGLIKSINDSLSFLSQQEKIDYKNYISLTYNELTKCVTFKLNQKYIRNFKFPDHILYMMGFLPNQIKKTETDETIKIAAHHPPDMSGGMNYLYVYCDILQPQIVANTLAPLLQVVNIEGKFMEMVNRAYIAPHYTPILKKCFHTIEINIKNDQFEAINFVSGKSLVKIHFRKVEKNIFLQ